MFRRTRRPITWLAIFAVLLHAFLPLAHAATGSRGMVVTLCSVDGSRLVFVPTPAEHGGTGDDGSAPGRAYKCPLCLAGAHLALADAGTLPLSLPSWLHHVQRPTSLTRVAPRLPWLLPSPRAPPVAHSLHS